MLQGLAKSRQHLQKGLHTSEYSPSSQTFIIIIVRTCMRTFESTKKCTFHGGSGLQPQSRTYIHHFLVLLQAGLECCEREAHNQAGSQICEAQMLSCPYLQPVPCSGFLAALLRTSCFAKHVHVPAVIPSCVTPVFMFSFTHCRLLNVQAAAAASEAPAAAVPPIPSNWGAHRRRDLVTKPRNDLAPDAPVPSGAGRSSCVSERDPLASINSNSLPNANAAARMAKQVEARVLRKKKMSVHEQSTTSKLLAQSAAVTGNFDLEMEDVSPD